MPIFRPRTPAILIVDDDPSGLMFFSLALRRYAFEVFTAASVAEARDIVLRRGARHFECVVTDYRMPESNGLDLLEWMQREEPVLSVIVVTAGGQKETIQASLRGGAADFLEKPVSKSQLGEAIEKGIQQTRERRRLQTMATGVEAAGKMSQVFTSVRTPELGRRLSYFHYSANAIGGDFLNATSLGRSGEILILGDVSGHDVKAGFISSYFQGLSRGYLDAERPPRQLLEAFNRQLNEEWASVGEEDHTALTIPPSLSLAVLERERSGTFHYLNAGLPDGYISRPDGRIERIPQASSPLGWQESPDFQEAQTQLEKGALFYLMTDGLRDCAVQMRLDPLALVFQLLSEHSEPLQEWLGDDVRDDILAIRYQACEEAPLDAYPQPIFHEEYAGDEVEAIDELQACWQRSLRFALPGRLEGCLYEVLLCCREAILNAMVHGCGGNGQRTCSLQISWIAIADRLRIRIDDPGPGHSLNCESIDREDPTTSQGHLGLLLIRNLCHEMWFLNDGATLVFDFCLPAPVPEKRRTPSTPPLP